MAEYTIGRTGDRPLAFKGTLIAEAKGNPDPQRWYELRTYSTDGGKYVVEIAYQSSFVHKSAGKTPEPDHREAAILESPEQVAQVLTDYRKRATDCVMGFPTNNPVFADRQRKLLQSIVGEYDRLTQMLLTDAAVSDPRFVERIE